MTIQGSSKFKSMKDPVAVGTEYSRSKTIVTKTRHRPLGVLRLIQAGGDGPVLPMEASVSNEKNLRVDQSEHTLSASIAAL